MPQKVNRRWICTDIWMDTLPFFDRPQLGLKLALLSPRFDVLVDAHFDGTSELPMLRQITIRKDIGMPKLFVDGKFEGFPLPKYPLPNTICLRRLEIEYIDHSIITFLRSNQQFFDGRGTVFAFAIFSHKNKHLQPLWNAFVSEIWPIFAPNISHLILPNGDHLDNLRHFTSPTILCDLNELIYINSSADLFPDGIGDDGPNATTAQALSNWLHTPRNDGQPKGLRCIGFDDPSPDMDEWINYFKKEFLRANTSSVTYNISFLHNAPTPIVPFELVNERAQQKLKLEKDQRDFTFSNRWIIRRCPIGKSAVVQQRKGTKSDNLNGVSFSLRGDKDCIGPL